MPISLPHARQIEKVLKEARPSSLLGVVYLTEEGWQYKWVGDPVPDEADFLQGLAALAYMTADYVNSCDGTPDDADGTEDNG
jgi:hypothetical protein